MEDAGKYLNLPTNWGRSKRGALDYIMERIMKKVYGWKFLFLNNAGKEILIKAVITVIPTL